MPINKEIQAYNAAQPVGDKLICDALAQVIVRHLPGAECKIWHRHPVWFLESNPIVGYHKLKDCVRLLFWSGRSFDEPGLADEGGFKTAGTRFTAADQIVAKDLKRWLAKSIEIQWDYKNIVKRNGKLERMKLRCIVNHQQTDNPAILYKLQDKLVFLTVGYRTRP